MPVLSWGRVFLSGSAAASVATAIAFFCAVQASDGAEAKAFTFAVTSAMTDGIRHPASSTNVAAPEPASAVAGGGLGFASAYAAGRQFASHAPTLQVRAYGRAGGQDHTVAGVGSASASWSDDLLWYSDLIEPIPPLDFLRFLAIFRFHVSGAIYGPRGTAHCGYSLTIDAFDQEGYPVRYGTSGSYTEAGTINETREIGIPTFLLDPVYIGKSRFKTFPKFTMGISVSGESLYDTAADWLGDGEANFGSTFALDTIYLADEHGNPVTGYTNSYIMGDNGPYKMGPPAGGFLNEIVVLDRFGRRLNERGVTLVDWEGQIANPAIRVLVVPPSDTTFPATAKISCPQARVYFDTPSTVGESGPSKTLTFTNSTPLPLLVSIFPDRDGADEDWPISIYFTSASGATRTLIFNAHVIDQDQPTRPVEFPVIVDFSRDQTGFFADASRRTLYQQLANDWAYFFADPGLDPVAAGAETTFIWNSAGFNGGAFIKNTNAYRGYLLYAYGINQSAPPYRSGGEPSSAGGFLSVGGKSLNLRRSGGQELEVKGNFNQLGWYVSTNDSDWWKASNLGDVQNDLASIPHHEMGHAFIFNPAQPAFASFKTLGSVKDARVLAYQGAYPSIDSFDHLPGAVDRLSGKGAFGYEYYGSVPARRWLITKLDLLVAQAIGYPLRETSPFVPPTIVTNALPRTGVGASYAQTLQARGGVPFYRWSIASGNLPPGLALDSFTGAITGVPTTVGTYSFAVRLEDYDEASAPADATFTIRVEASPLEITTVQRTGQGVEVSYRTIPNHTYRLEASDDLRTWIAVQSGVPGTGAIVTTTDSASASQSHRFYRVVEL